MVDKQVGLCYDIDMDNTTWFTPTKRRVRLSDGRTGTEHRAPIDSLWSVELDDGTVLFYSVVSDRNPTYTDLEEA